MSALGAGAAAAGVGRDFGLQTELQKRAREIDPTHPRAVLMDLEPGLAPAVQLLRLEGVYSTDPGVEALIQTHRAIAYLRQVNLDAAERCIETAERLVPDSATVQMLRVNLAVQRGRLDLINNRQLRGEELRGAVAAAAHARRSLLDQRRYGESARLLMLGSDALLLQEDRRGAAQLLDAVTAEELAEPDVPEVLGDAAVRVLDFALAMRVTEDAARTEAIERIRAAAMLETGNAAQREAALETLDRLVAGAGPEANEAAFLRLHAALGSAHIAWSDEARDQLVGAGHEREATVLEANYVARHDHDLPRARALFEAQADAPWALVWLMRLALTYNPGDQATEAAADRVMAIAPSQAIRVECGRAFARSGNLLHAQEVLLGVARDPGAATGTRADAYDLLVRIAGHEENRWDRAHDLLTAWIELTPGDDRANQWRPMVGQSPPQERTVAQLAAGRGGLDS